jgi:hypothetical protein
MTEIFNDAIKLRIQSVEINFLEGIINCSCHTIAQTPFNKFPVQHNIVLTEADDLNNNPAWTNDDLKNALAVKMGISTNEIVFLRPIAPNG